MDPIAREVWCEALRSGEFKQAHRALKRDGGYCCLGVAAEIFPLDQNMKCGFLSNEACELLGIGEQDELANMNDSGKTFAEIADYIEANL